MYYIGHDGVPVCGWCNGTGYVQSMYGTRPCRCYLEDENPEPNFLEDRVDSE